MSDLPGNPYAESLNDYADPRNSLEALATLALAYEQRTANLIALFGEGFAGTGLPYGEIYAQIKERLALSGAET